MLVFSREFHHLLRQYCAVADAVAAAAVDIVVDAAADDKAAFSCEIVAAAVDDYY